MKELAKPRHSDMAIKVCGMKDADNIKSVSLLTPMLMGFIFYDKTPRNASGLDTEIVKGLPDYVRPVAVFVNASRDYIDNIITLYGFNIIQLHGCETPEECRYWKDRGMTVFKALPVGNLEDIAHAREYEGSVDAFLFDTRSDKAGGSGKHFDWSLLDDYNIDVPYLLSGGIGPDDVDAIVAAMRPGMAGIDINSRFEISPGVKDQGLLTNFILSLRGYNEDEQIAKPFWEKA